MVDLSIIIPTFNRCQPLVKCLTAIRDATQLAFEIIVVDGASSDGTTDVLTQMGQSLGERLRVIREPRREGFVKAANKGFRVARGRHLTWLNDDARPLSRCLDRAVEQFALSPRTVGMVAMFHSSPVTRNIAFEAHHLGRAFHVLHVRGTLYANFGVASRGLFERLGYFDERYFLNGADPDFSLKVWQAGLSVVPAIGALIDHDEIHDDRRDADLSRADNDNAKLFAKWDLPEKSERANEFNQTKPCTLRGLRASKAA